MKRKLFISATVVLAMVQLAQTDSITHGSTTINMDFVNIGYAGNDAQSAANRAHADGGGDGYGSVGYNYRVGKFEVTSDQWDAVAAADVNVGDASWNSGLNPAGGVSWIEAAKFCNWLTSGSYSQGAYQFSDPLILTGIDRASAVSSYGTVYVLPTADEWFKAAYFKSDGSGYTLYSTGDALPFAGTNGLNYSSAVGSVWNIGAGSLSSIENNGTFDINGNAEEWVESDQDDAVGGKYDSTEGVLSSDLFLSKKAPAKKYGNGTGLRVAAIPEPSSVALMGFAAGLAWFMRKRLRR